MDRIQNVRVFEEVIFYALNKYIKAIEQFHEDSVLQINI